MYRKYIFTSLLLFIVGGVSSSRSICAHGVPIDLFANSATGRLFYFDNFDHGELELQTTEISTDSPGFGVNFTSNGISPGTTFELEVTQSLLYWDGSQLAAPSVAIQIINPNFTNFYTVSATSAEQTGMFWGTYAGASFWDAHGLYRIGSTSAPAGIYGLGLRVVDTNALGYDPTKPLLLPLIYDPSSQFSAAQIQLGIAALQEQLIVPATGDFDGDLDVDGADYLAWARGYQPGKSFTSTLSDGDADADSDVDFADLQFWSSQFGTSITVSSGSIVPEPRTIIFIISLALVSVYFRARY